MEDVIIIGAGIAGLSCATVLREKGLRPVVLERARGVGGRCATRRVEGQPVDHGVIFLHGRNPMFLEALESVEGAAVVPDWPREVVGQGQPCQPRAFAPEERRLAFAEGVSAFPKHLAARQDVRLGENVEGLASRGDALAVRIAGGTVLRTQTVVLALAVEQARALMTTLPAPPPPVRSGEALLNMIGSLCCWTVLAGYRADAPAPPWDVLYPDASESIQLVSFDSSKRPAATQRVLVIQALPRWSRLRLEASADTVVEEILEETGRLMGAWAVRPSWAQAHRWRYARTDGASALSAPLLFTLDGGARLGIAGEAFGPGGGVEGAWLSGVRLAERLTGG